MPVARNGRTVVLGEDDLEVRGYLETALKCQGFTVELAQDGDEVLSCLRGALSPVSAVVLDIIMPRRDGLDALREIRRFDRDVPVIMISGASSTLNVVEAMKNGASDFLAKPINLDDLRKALKLAIEVKPALAAKQPDQPPPTVNKSNFFGTSQYMCDLEAMVAQVGWSETPVLIQGETGVGKEVFARELHAHSPRARKPILKLNCAALPSELVESELFGYERGAFTGAFQKKPGMFELADEGTLLLDEIGDMDFKLQAKLLQVLQDQEFQRLGGKDTIHVDVRIIAATHRDLEKAITEGSFREDLYYRLNVINIRVPPLRERKEDIVPMAEFLIKKHTARGAAPVQIPPSLKDAIENYRWPGNIRELENLARRFLVLRDARVLEQELRGKIKHESSVAAETYPHPLPLPAALPSPPVDPPPVDVESAPLPQEAPVLEQVAIAKREAERVAILGALKSTNWNRRQASVMLHIDYKALLYKMKKLSIKKDKAGPIPPQIHREHSMTGQSVA